jgi:hypothetical protein
MTAVVRRQAGPEIRSRRRGVENEPLGDWGSERLDPAFFVVARRTRDTPTRPDRAVRDSVDAMDAATTALALLASGFDDLTILGTRGGFDAIQARLDRSLPTGTEAAVRYLGPPFEDVATSAALAAALRAQTPSSSDLLADAVDRVFDGDLAALGRFVACLQTALPAGTRLLMRGSSVVGRSYLTGEPFDAAGPRTSDLDLVVTGSEAMALWSPSAFYVPGINSQPLCDDARWVAPDLDPARTRAQEVARRPVAIQAMAGWFLELRALVQGQPHVALDDLGA